MKGTANVRSAKLEGGGRPSARGKPEPLHRHPGSAASLRVTDVAVTPLGGLSKSPRPSYVRHARFGHGGETVLNAAAIYADQLYQWKVVCIGPIGNRDSGRPNVVHGRVLLIVGERRLEPKLYSGCPQDQPGCLLFLAPTEVPVVIGVVSADAYDDLLS